MELRIQRRFGQATSVFALICSLIHLYAPVFGIWEGLRLISLSVFLVLTILLCPASQHVDRQKQPVRFASCVTFDTLLVAGVIATLAYIYWDYDDFFARTGLPTRADLVIGVIYLLIIMEATRRSLGWALVVLSGVFLLFALYGQSMPRLIAHSGASFSDAIEFAFRDVSGILGIPVGVMASYVVLFVFFGAILERAGAGDFLLQISTKLAGRGAAGPAKIAVISSALFGTISGSAVANVVTTGAFTIPLMKRTGIRADRAGAIEAVASTGGIIMPPIMGAAAFIAAQNVRISYIEFALAATIPAIYYFVSLFLFIDLEGRKHNIRSMDSIDAADVRLLREAVWILPPFALLIYLLIVGYSPGRSAAAAMLVLCAGVIWRHGWRVGWGHIIKGLIEGSKASAPLVVAAAAAGFVIAMVYVTGVGLRFTTIIVQLSGGNLLLCLTLVAIATLILGMGLPITAAYLTAATLAVPALKALGVSELAAHMFIFYYAALSAITPPVALASYAAAGLAGGSFWSTGVHACRYGIVGFFVPYLFAYRQPLLILGAHPFDVAHAAITGLLGILALGLAFVGYFRAPINILWRAALLAVAIALTILPFLWLDLISLALLLAFLIQHVRRAGKITEATPLAASGSPRGN
jgi:TRAP transporter 4TM/12TM fusion protein